MRVLVFLSSFGHICLLRSCLNGKLGVLGSCSFLFWISLAAVFGRIIVEDAFITAEPRISRFVIHHDGVSLPPMAWSDNIVVFGESIKKVAQTLAVVADVLWDTCQLRIKTGSAEIVPASSQKYTWPAMQCGGIVSQVSKSMKCLGFSITCNGDTSEQKARSLGCLRGSLAKSAKIFKSENKIICI